ncbi:MAG: DUF4838 domain-containing protein [Bacteroidia bacterium]|nr:DUF4838 domain-containing protein [Bacteroidia bacterium]
MKSPTHFLLICLILLFSNCNHLSGLYVGSHPLTTIVLDEHVAETKAANELQHYLNRISGSDIAISREKGSQGMILLGKDESLPEHGISYGVEGGNLYLKAGSSEALLDAVYTFLENELGARFYSPKVERIPRQSSFVFPEDLHYHYSPPIHVRTVHSRLYYKNPRFAEKQKVTTEAFPGYVPRARVHTFHRFLPAEQFYEEHPEYYALRKGRRLTTQLCLSNEAVFHIVSDSVEALLQAYPESNVISVSQDDNTQYCQCESCEAIHEREDSPAGSMIYFVNKIAHEFPDKSISTLAYQYTRKAPRHIKPAANVLITLCSIECDRSAAIGEKCQDFTRDLQAWAKLTDNIRIWDYTTQFTNFLAPFPNLHTLQPNIQLFTDNNAKWIFEQHSNQPSELFELRSYVTAKLLWNPEADISLIMDDFLKGYYEEAAPFVRSYIDRVHEELGKDSSFFLFLYGDPSQAFESFLQLDLLKEYDNYFEKAREAVTNNAALAERVAEARLSVDYAILEYAKRDMKAAGVDAFFDLENRLNRFKETTERGEITAMNEMRFTVAEYLEMYQKSLDRAQASNLASGKSVKLFTKAKKYAGENPLTLTDGAYGGNNFYANWLGFEGNDLEAIVDLESPQSLSRFSAAFLQVSNHIVFFPEEVLYYGSLDGVNFELLGKVNNQAPLTKESKINDIQYFELQVSPGTFRYIKIIGRNMDVAPDWHNAAGLPAWVFIDEFEVS